MASATIRQYITDDGGDAQGHRPRPPVDRCGAGGARRGVTAGGGRGRPQTSSKLHNHGRDPRPRPTEDRG